MILSDYRNMISIQKIEKKYRVGRKRILKILDDNGVKNRNNRIYEFDRRFFQKIDTEKKAYWLGFLYADGSVYISKYNISHHVTLKLSSKDVIHLEQYKKDLDLPHEIKFRKENSFGGGFEGARIRICSKEMVNDLIRHGCFINKTFKLLFPNINENLLNHFMRGYFDGDGSISIEKKRNDIQLTILGTYDFLKEYQKILIENCDVNVTEIRKKENIYYLKYGGNLQINKIKEFLYKNSLTYLKRKKDIFDIKIKRFKSNRPPYKQLLMEIEELGCKGTGKKYGVRDSTIRKWKMYYEKYCEF